MRVLGRTADPADRGADEVQAGRPVQPMMAWVDSTPMPVVRAIGAVEVLDAAGLILPPVTGIATGLALVAAIGFVVLQILATGVHLRRGDRRIALNLALIAASAATTWLATTWL
ncbi:DoxX family protein [Streptomyces sp. MS19]|uniref:DoxX family protein n=1 Tax=Streptomyces sp. MS19 TaxID=3385972 RepID=UPI0039A26D1C